MDQKRTGDSSRSIRAVARIRLPSGPANMLRRLSYRLAKSVSGRDASGLERQARGSGVQGLYAEQQRYPGHVRGTLAVSLGSRSLWHFGKDETGEASAREDALSCKTHAEVSNSSFIPG